MPEIQNTGIVSPSTEMTRRRSKSSSPGQLVTDSMFSSHSTILSFHSCQSARFPPAVASPIGSSLLSSRPSRSTLWCDNLGATYLCANPVFHSKTKHMDIDYHFVRDRVAANSLKISFCSTNDQLANILTKQLVSDKFLHFATSLKVVDTPLDSRGRISS
ncbi:uncharacterized protein LOC131164539 isoform X2 [Malania oleifera]|uniref:uncharacterized protein LOC131164539 isoform X2 n=1 Tax=Malania oleifera TaxID=397392 RepID=UPI0025AE7467|nr:uncharacterized protein LOC131164539 isoform X2 [Malania oleifera]